MKYLDCEEMRPKCTDNSREFPFADVVVEDVSDANISRIINTTVSRMKAGNNKTCIVIKKSLSHSEHQEFMNKYINRVTGVREAYTSRLYIEELLIVEMTVVPK